jgi:hypothetical protein
MHQNETELFESWENVCQVLKSQLCNAWCYITYNVYSTYCDRQTAVPSPVTDCAHKTQFIHKALSAPRLVPIKQSLLITLSSEVDTSSFNNNSWSLLEQAILLVFCAMTQQTYPHPEGHVCETLEFIQ